MLIRSFSGRAINSIKEWQMYSPPASKDLHWVDGRSAKELAKAWVNENGVPHVPQVLSLLMQSHTTTLNLEIESAIPECKTVLDSYGKGRMHDLLLIGKTGNEKVVISIEAKVDETFGPTIRERRRYNPVKSNVDKRIAHLSDALISENNFEHLRYQLLHGIGGTLIEAKKQGANFAIFVVHEFLSNEINLNKHTLNTNDLNEFVSCLIKEQVILDYGCLVGPIFVPGGKDISSDIPLFIGKIKTEVH
ncbi:hypothetical protein P4361_21890 [Fictibacillus sp. B-59209]|uniref:DUF6946 family protein n=1 Tax=Fictibacillus sp. B-59209 TaxID=3024873 RepID=UPI002E22CB48|nr:hypothetical protein [Fictibacillus sp. B-59209]